jgi:hypothetical protein
MPMGTTANQPVSPGSCAPVPPNLVHIDFQDSATPDRNRFFVRRNPSGEMVIVNDSPSISISRRMVFWSLVGMEDWYPSRFSGFGAYGFLGPQTDEPARPLSGPSSQHIIDEPLPLLLPNDGISDDSALLEHVVGWLEDALKV